MPILEVMKLIFRFQLVPVVQVTFKGTLIGFLRVEIFFVAFVYRHLTVAVLV